MGLIPGAEAAKTTFDFIKAAISKPDAKKTNTWLDKLDVDDKMSAIVDDTVENGFMQAMAKSIEGESDTKPLESDFNINAKMVNYLKQQYSGRHIAGIAENKNMDLKEVAKEIREIITHKQKELKLTFEEDSHKYTMIDVDGKLRDDFPSVSKVLKSFYEEFDSEGISYRKANGDPYEQQRLLDEWAAAVEYSVNIGSRTHFILEEHTLDQFGIKKELRQPIFNCDAEQIVKSDTMIVADIS